MAPMAVRVKFMETYSLLMTASLRRRKEFIMMKSLLICITTPEELIQHLADTHDHLQLSLEEARVIFKYLPGKLYYGGISGFEIPDKNGTLRHWSTDELVDQCCENTYDAICDYRVSQDREESHMALLNQERVVLFGAFARSVYSEYYPGFLGSQKRKVATYSSWAAKDRLNAERHKMEAAGN